MTDSSPEASLRSVLDDLRQAVAAAAMHTFTWDIGAGTVAWSDGVEALFGLSPGGFDGRFESFIELLPPEDRDDVRHAIDRALHGETPLYAVEHRICAPDGAVTWVACHGSVFRDDDGRPRRMLGIISDVTQRRRAEEERRAAELALRASEERYRTLFEHALDGILLFDADHRVVDANESACRMFGYSCDDLIALPAASLFSPDVAKTKMSEHRFRRRDGTTFQGEVTTKALVDGRFHCVVRDVTERKQVEAQLLLTDRMASLGRLASGVAHELNNPLAYVMLNLELVARKIAQLPPTTPEAIDPIVRAVDDARDGAERMRRIVRMMTAFGRGDEEATGPVDVNAVLDSAAEIATMQLRRQARLVRQYDAAAPARANAFRLGQVFVNLLVNAADALPEDAAESEIRLRTYTRGDDSVIIEVSDNGVGIPAEVQARIFDPFFTTKPIGHGTGLGLSVCHAIVTSFGGTLACESVPGEATTFRVVLPVARLGGSENHPA